MDVTRLEGGRQRLGFVDGDDRYLVELGPFGVEVVLEAFQHHALTELVRGDPEGAGPHRGEAVLRGAHLFERTAVDDGHGASAGALQGLDQKRGLRAVQLEADRQVVDLLDAVDVGQKPRVDRLLWIEGTVVGEEHVVGRKDVAVVKEYPCAEVESPLQPVGRDAPVTGEVALGHQVGVDVGETAQNIRRNLKLEDLVDLCRV